MFPHQNRFIVALISLLILFSVGVIGYKLIEPKWTFFDSIYMTIITLTTVGYSDAEMSTAGKVFTIFLLIGGFGVFAYSITAATAFIVEGELHEVFRKRSMDRSINKLSNHFIICGAGDTGIHAIEELIKMKVDFVVIERDHDRINHLLETMKFLYVIGDATDDEILHRANVDHAKGVITTLSADRDNLFVVLSARQLNPNLRIVSKAVENNSSIKLCKAGADDVVLADHIGGARLATAVTRPIVTDFLDLMLESQTMTRFSQSIVRDGSQLIGKTLYKSAIPKLTGLVIVGVRSPRGEFIFNPPSDLRLEIGSGLIAIATPEQIQKLHKLTSDEQ